MNPRAARFAEIHRTNAWTCDETRSGPGSSRIGSQVIRQALPDLIQRFGIKSILDAPCGDWNWMKDVTVNLDFYIGIDIVPEIISGNAEKFGARNRRFAVKDIVTDLLPRADLILCRDCLAHLPLKDCVKAISNFRNSRSTYLLATTSPSITRNRDIKVGDWAARNLELEPFSFPPPLELINERSQEKMDCDKNLGLWRL